MTPLTGCRILLIGIGFYDYEAAIAAEMRTLGAEVRLETQEPARRPRWLGRGTRQDGDDLARHQADLLDRVASLGPLDHIVVIKGDKLDAAFLSALRAARPGARLTAYHWDSMARYPALVAQQAAYDRVLTFDHADATASASFLLRPLFYRPELTQTKAATPRFDLCFVGWLHHDRLAQLEAIERQAREQGLSRFIYLSTGRRTKAQLWLRGRGRHVHTRPISFADYVRVTAESRAVVDLPHPQQTGLTMRAIETVGAGRRLFTTGRSVTGYDFFGSGNVTLLDPAIPVFDVAEVRAPVEPVAPDIVDRYSLRRWVTDVLGVTAPGDFYHPPADEKLAA